LYEDWLGGVVEGLLMKGGLYSSRPLRGFLKDEFSGASLQRSLNVGIVDLLAGEYVDFSEAKLTRTADLVDVMFASLSTIVYYPPAEVFGSSFVDGAAVYDIDIFTAINRCEALGYSE
jgi:hypothetical protein